jgi:hypothetical protein
VYVAQMGDVKFFIMVYVDDLILLRKWEMWSFSLWSMWMTSFWCATIKKNFCKFEELSQKFEMKDLGDLHFFSGMEVERNCDEWLLCINQIKYLKEILKCFRMEECKPIGVPLDPKVKL